MGRTVRAVLQEMSIKSLPLTNGDSGLTVSVPQSFQEQVILSMLEAGCQLQTSMFMNYLLVPCVWFLASIYPWQGSFSSFAHQGISTWRWTISETFMFSSWWKTAVIEISACWSELSSFWHVSPRCLSLSSVHWFTSERTPASSLRFQMLASWRLPFHLQNCENIFSPFFAFSLPSFSFFLFLLSSFFASFLVFCSLC